jgi:hypothetical protein
MHKKQQHAEHEKSHNVVVFWHMVQKHNQNWDWFLELVLEVESELEMELDKN